MPQQIALITGANKGIGFETARQLGKRGMHIIVAGRDAAALDRASISLHADGVHATPVVLDVTDGKSIAAAADRVTNDFGLLDVLVNNAGIMRDAFDAAPSAQPLTLWRETFETNVFGMVAVTQAFLPLLKKSSAARIVNVSSVLGSLTESTNASSPFYDFKIPAYNVSKSAVNAWTIHLAHEVRDTPIKVNAAHPGFVKTDLHGVDAPMNAVEGAETSVRLATLGPDGPSGRFFFREEALPW
ncbi:SDR family oxidoreductase [Luteibacter sp. 9133]|uniref:SDR family oxidoreductase n=1 Tax=Luteibacter sp. 9133 TaxID=1500891 RepID=UPI0005B7C65A|nr:SDR family oxidoreductase [Luteibacter sp. 9133]